MNHKQKKGKGMTLEQNICELRKIYGLSQEQVADAMDINRSTLVAVEKGDRDLNSEELGKLADYLGIDITELVAQEVPDYEKYEQMILEVVDEYVKQTEGKSLPKTFLAKLLYLTDFSWFYDELKPMSGMKYRKIEYGPVPDQFFRVYEEMAEAGKLSIEESSKGAYWTTLTRAGQANRRSKLTAEERQRIGEVVKKWKDSNTREIVAFTHSQLPYQGSRLEQFIPYELITQEEPEHVY